MRRDGSADKKSHHTGKPPCFADIFQILFFYCLPIESNEKNAFRQRKRLLTFAQPPSERDFAATAALKTFARRETENDTNTCTEVCKIIPACLKIPAPSAASLLDQPCTAQSANFGRIWLNSQNLAGTILHHKKINNFNNGCFGKLMNKQMSTLHEGKNPPSVVWNHVGV